MTNLWSSAAKQIELWKRANSISMSAVRGAFSVTGFAASFVSPRVFTASRGTYAIVGQQATLIYSASTGQATGLLLGITYP